MKIKLPHSIHENASTTSSSKLGQLLQYFSGLNARANAARPKKLKQSQAQPDQTPDEINLYVDLRNNMKSEHNDKSGDLEILVFVGDGPELSDKSIPCLAFSLDSLIDEKIELLDGDLVSEKNILILQRLAIRLNEHSNQLKQALKRHQLNTNNASGKNSPLW